MSRHLKSSLHFGDWKVQAAFSLSHLIGYRRPSPWGKPEPEQESYIGRQRMAYRRHTHSI
ncbi:hypothetical protein [Kingella denitrificans]